MTQFAKLRQGADGLGLSLSDGQLTQMEHYLMLLQKWNRTYNLTAVRDEAQMVDYHLLDSLSIVPFLGGGSRLLDVGSGGGMPGIPVAIACPQRQVVLLDANEKKTAFLRQAVIELNLDNVTVVVARVERYQAVDRFDCVTSRAFAELAEFVSLTHHLLLPSGQWLAMKGAYPNEEIAVLPMNAKVAEILRVDVPGLLAERHLVRMLPQ